MEGCIECERALHGGVRSACGREFLEQLVSVTDADAGGGGGAVKAEQVCRLMLPGARTCSPFEEGILHAWIGGLVAHRLIWQ